MAVLAGNLSEIGGRAREAGRALQGEVVEDLAAAEALWRGLEAAPARLGTPYQRFDWARAYERSGACAGTAKLLVLRDERGAPRLLLPLEVSRTGGLVVARGLGGTHANFHMPLFASREAAAIDADDLTHALALAGREAGIDVFALAHQPRTWEGAVNPLARCGEAGASDAYGMMLGPDPEATLRRAFSADARKKLRSKERRLSELVGPLAYRRAADPGEAGSCLAAFYAQKSERFSALGIADPYRGEPVRRFLDAAAAGADPAIELHMLVAERDGRVLATFGGAVDGQRYSGMMTSFDQTPEIARCSPGDLLLHHLVREQTERGRAFLDLGIGEARYKASTCDETIAIVDVIVPVSLRGRLYGAASLLGTRVKRRIKRDPRLYALARRLRRRG